MASSARERARPGIPLMHPAAAVDAAWAAQPDGAGACVGEVRRLRALVELRVPHALYGLVVGVGQCLLALSIEACA